MFRRLLEKTFSDSVWTVLTELDYFIDPCRRKGHDFFLQNSEGRSYLGFKQDLEDFFRILDIPISTHRFMQ